MGSLIDLLDEGVDAPRRKLGQLGVLEERMIRAWAESERIVDPMEIRAILDSCAEDLEAKTYYLRRASGWWNTADMVTQKSESRALGDEAGGISHVG